MWTCSSRPGSADKQGLFAVEMVRRHNASAGATKPAVRMPGANGVVTSRIPVAASLVSSWNGGWQAWSSTSSRCSTAEDQSALNPLKWD